MRKILLIFIGLIICTSPLFAQDTLISYFDKDWDVIFNKDDAKYYRKEYLDIDKKLWSVNDYYMSGQIQMTGTYETQKKDVKHGLFTYYSKEGQIEKEESFMRGVNHGVDKSWYDNGNPYEFINYRYGKKHGELTTYWKNGQLRRKDIFENGEFKSGTVWDSLGVNVEYYKYMTMPEFPGGQSNLFRFISQTVKYPWKAKNRRIQGKVIIQFVVNIEGNIADVKVLKSVHKLLDNEALRVINSMPKWIPGTKEGKPVFVRYQVPINFQLN